MASSIPQVWTLDSSRRLRSQLWPDLRKLLEEQADLASIRESYQRLEGLTFAIAEKMYGGGGDAPPA